ncbi:ALG6, ALG8 glycosyltransferase [Hymenopellis radicata]|nr:ALG6, ALG8 glycosyltransferase [Hymenopellis radicata]
MYGDFEAQRHWLEVALHVPLRQWYYYDLQWWGMDYPPLTGYVSWLCGYVGDRIDRTWFALDESRGREDDGLKLFMRWTVVVWDALVYVPAVLWWMRVWVRSSKARSVSLLITLLQPSLLLIDFGHFQYNSFMLGLTLLSVSCFFHQMSLYYAPAIGTYLLSKCIHQRSPKLFIQYGAVTAATFAVVFAPFLLPAKDGWPLTQVIHRIFPFARGLFEDKVANFWCASNVLIKWKFLLSTTALLRVSAILTLLAFLPAVVLLLQSPDPRLLPYAMLTSSLAFFLFGFQVHEKTILVCMLPVMMVQGEWTVLANNVALFSMWPLLKRDGLGVQYIAILLLWNRLVWRPSSSGRPNIPSRSLIDWLTTNWKSALTTGTYAAMFALHALEAVFPTSPIARLPDLWPVLNVLVSTPLFFLLWAWSVRAGVEERWAGSEFGMREDEIKRRSVPPSPIFGRKKI